MNSRGAETRFIRSTASDVSFDTDRLDTEQ